MQMMQNTVAHLWLTNARSAIKAWQPQLSLPTFTVEHSVSVVWVSLWPV